MYSKIPPDYITSQKIEDLRVVENLRFYIYFYLLTFFGPCIVIYLRNKDKQDEIFFPLNLFQLHLEHGFVWCRNLDTSSSRSELPGKF